MSDSTWATGDALTTYINGPPASTYVKLLPLSLGTGCEGAVSAVTGSTVDYAIPAYGSALSVTGGIAKTSLTIPEGSYKICVALDRSAPPFTDGDYCMINTAQVQVFLSAPPSPPVSPAPFLPPPEPPAAPPPSPPPPPQPPDSPPAPAFSAEDFEGLGTCIFGGDGSQFSPPPSLPPMPPNNPPPPPLSPGGRMFAQETPEALPPPGCFTVGQMVLICGLIVVLIVILCTCTVCRKYLNSFNCGPGALMASFSAVRNVPTNKGLKEKSVTLKIGGSKQNTSSARMCVHATFVCCCCLACGAIAAAVIIVIIQLQGIGTPTVTTDTL